jgi:hypothetical protein
VFDATEAQFAWVIKSTVSLLARGFSVLFAGNSAGTVFVSWTSRRKCLANLLAFLVYPVLPAEEIARRERFKKWLQR